MGSDERAIRELHAAWIAAVNAGDLARLLDWMTADVVLLSPGNAPSGRQEFSAVVQAAHAQSQILCRSELQEVVVTGDLAYTVCQDALTVTPRADAAAVELAGHRLTIYRKQADGRWLLARDAHTLTPVAR